MGRGYIRVLKHNKLKKEKGHALEVYKFFLPEAWRHDKKYFLLKIFQLVEQTVNPFLSILTLPLIVDELLGGRRIERLILYVAIIGLGGEILSFIDALIGNYLDRYSEKFNIYFQELASKKIMGLDFQVTEDKKALDQIALAQEGISWYSGGLTGIVDVLFSVIQDVIKIFGISAIILSKAPLLLIITVVVLVVSALLNRKVNSVEQKSYKNLAKSNRIFGYIGWNIVDFRYGKDVRLYHAQKMIGNNFKKYAKMLSNEWNKQAKDTIGYLMLLDMTDVIRDLGSYLYIGFLAIYGKISLGIMAQLFNASSAFYMATRSLVFNLQNITKRTNYAFEFVKLMNYPDAIHKGTKKVARGPHTFEFKNVCFSYPGSDVQVLKGINLKIEPCEHLSVVGLNGAGKTTFIKLLCRLYDPTSGQILMDGTDIREYDYQSYMNEFSPVFQDFKLFAFTFKENILVSDYVNDSVSDKEKEKKLQSIFKKTGLSDKIASLEKGDETYIFKHYNKDGIEPSGGEQQKLAIARTLYKDSPVVILDEPTAALDPIAEYEIYRQFEDLVGGKTGIYISHRLSSCQFCDHIAVFSNGVISEYGTHESLVNRKNGLYAKMFHAQAQYYAAS